jgi:uncharacterized membrane protein YfcA
LTINLPLFFFMTGSVAFLIGLSKGGLGGLMGALSTPLMALVMPADQVIGMILPLLMIADVFAVALHWKRWEWRLVRLLLPGAVIGVTIGSFLIEIAPSESLRKILGVIVLVFTVYKIFEKRILHWVRYEPHNWHGWLSGTLAGFASSLAHNGGPPVSIYLLLQDVSPRVFIATSALFFMILNWIKVPYYFYIGLFDFQRLTQIAWLIPLLPLGVVVGRWASSKVDRQVFERIIVALLGITGLLLIFG